MSSNAILPGATLGILGGGQLGRMTAMAARSLGYGVAVLDPDPKCAAAAVADRCVVGSFDDAAAFTELARASQVVTYEIEKLGHAAMAAAEAITPVRPSPALLTMIQDRALQKRWLAEHGFPVGPYEEADAADALATFVTRHGPARAKTRKGGYDGRGQARVGTPQDAEAAFASLGRAPCVVEKELSLEAELSVLVARRPGGETGVYPPARNWHTDGILSVSVLPGELPPEVVKEAQERTRALAQGLLLEGLLAVEYFLTTDGKLLVNELSPRPHNTFHSTETACATSQFEQLVRAVCDLPLGSTEVVRPTALANLLGDLWLGDGPPPLEHALALPGVRLHLYGKEPRLGRKIGHLLALGSTPEKALTRVREALARLER